jgi:hypothetical protein
MGVIVTLIIGIFIFPAGTVADDVVSEITDVSHTPKWPVYGEGVNITATVSDPDGISTVDIIYCDDMLCYAPIAMTQIGSTDNYYGILPFMEGTWVNGSWVGYNIQVLDINFNITETKKIYYFYVSAINMTASVDENEIRMGESITISGSAIFNGNETSRVENSNLTIKITDQDSQINYVYIKTDSEGNFSKEIQFNSPGVYMINLTLTNRSMTAYYETSVMVIDIDHLSEMLQKTTCFPSQQLWVNGTAEYNTGDPVVDSDIEIDLNGTKWTGKTDSNGNYAILIDAPSELGNYDVNVTVTNGTLVHYNETELSVVAVPLPDLALLMEDINVTSDFDPHIAGNEIEIEVKIKNLGLADCEDVRIVIYRGNVSDDDLLAQNDDLAVSCGSYSIYTLTWTPNPGTYELNILVDPQDAFKESFEDNNNATITIFVDSDFDEDEIGDSVDEDDDNDGHLDDVDAFPNDDAEWLDTDLDDIGNNADTDDDGDGLSDLKEDIKKTDPLNPDTDGDGVPDGSDYDPLDPDVTVKPDEPESFPWIFIIIILAVVAMMVIFLMVTRKKEQ